MRRNPATSRVNFESVALISIAIAGALNIIACSSDKFINSLHTAELLLHSILPITISVIVFVSISKVNDEAYEDILVSSTISCWLILVSSWEILPVSPKIGAITKPIKQVNLIN